MKRNADVPAIGRDPDAFEAFYLEHLPWARRFVARRVDDAHAAADLTADIFLGSAHGERVQVQGDG
jgi:RNA polymerase sigma-70 factor (ECF subfamily)